MTKPSAFALAAALVITPLASSGALAAGAGGTQSHAWVSINGADAPGCGTGAAPCRTFQYAHDNIVQPGGSIYVQTPGNYGQLTIAHSLSIIAETGPVTIFAASNDAIDVQAGTSDAVVIQGLTLDGVGTGTNGINLTSGGSLTVTKCLVKGFSTAGVAVSPTVGGTNIVISDSNISSNVSFAPGVLIGPAGANSAARGIVHNIVLSNNAIGIYIRTTSAGQSASIGVEDSIISNSENGVAVVGPNASVTLNRVNTTGNATDLYNYGGGSTLISLQTNFWNTAYGPITLGSLH